jgi:uncharacterized membrane protein
MPAQRISSQRIIIAAAFLVLAIAAFAGPTSAKEYRFSHVDIEATVLSDGSMRVTEHRTYSFSGTFSWATWYQPTGEWELTEFSLEESGRSYIQSSQELPGSYQVTRSSDSVSVEFFYSAQDEDRTFIFRYRILGAVERYSDCAQLYWNFIGSDWDVPTDSVRIRVILPPGVPRDEVKAWAHGPLWGTVTVESPQSILVSVEGLPAFTPVEARILFPAQLVPSATRVRDTSILKDALAEETKWAEEANKKREEARLRLVKLAAWRNREPAIAAAYAALGFGILAGLLIAYGKERRPTFRGDYLRELPERYPPAILGVLWRFGHPSVEDWVATIADLARRGFLHITERQVAKGRRMQYDYEIARVNPNDESVREHEDILMRTILNCVGDGNSVTFKQIEAYAKEYPGQFQHHLALWKQSVRTAARAHDFFDESARTGRIAGVLTGIGIVGVSALGIRLIPLASLAGMVVGGLVSALSSSIRRRSAQGADQLARWKAFRRFLLHFSTLTDAPVPSLVLWEEYLVYAVTLGVAREVIRQISVVYPDATQHGAFAGTWFATSGGGEGLSSLEALSSSFDGLMKMATSAASSGSGGGGGMSSGGGGGGGGGGGRAG